MVFSASTPLPLILAIAFFLTTITTLVVSKRNRETILSRLHFRQRRASGASTPPRSLSPDHKTSSNVEKGFTDTSKARSGKPNYLSVFPPTRRSVLAELAQQPRYANTPAASVLAAGAQTSEIDITTLGDKGLPMTEDYDQFTEAAEEHREQRFTPMGFSTQEVRAMGDFPDHALLSGVPLPQEYRVGEGKDERAFGIEEAKKALPRPYRPFRWAYHQTMCT